LTYSIRPLGREDLDQVNEIDHEAFPTQWPPPNYRQELQNRMAHYIVAADDSRAGEAAVMTPGGGRRGLARWWPWRKPLLQPGLSTPRPYIAGFSGIWMMVDEAHITNIAVRKEYRGKGVGGLLLISTFDLAEDFKASFLTLEVRASNVVAQNLYERYGFVRVGLRRGYYLDNKEDALIMSTDSLASPELKAKINDLRASLTEKLGVNTGRN
jgi:[ribosomal protein S18]-alanine N-acetyltransferase